MANDGYSDQVDTIVIPKGHYYFNSGFQLWYPHNLRIVGAGQKKTILEPARKSPAPGDGFASGLLIKFNFFSGLLEISDLTIQVTDPSPTDPRHEGYLGPCKLVDGSWECENPNTTSLHNMIGIVGRSGPYDLEVHDVTMKGAAGDGTKRAPDDPIEGGLGGKNATYLLVNFVSTFPGTNTFRDDTFANAADTCVEAAWAFSDTQLTIEDSTFTGCFMGITSPYDGDGPQRFADLDFEDSPHPICVRGDINCYSPTGTYTLTQGWSVDVAKGSFGWGLDGDGNPLAGGTLFDYSRNVVEKDITIDGVRQQNIVIDDSPPVAIASADVGADNGGSATVTLDGSASYSPYFGDKVVSWKWTDENGILLSTMSVVGVDLPAGDHSITLTVLDKRSVGYWPTRQLPGTDTIAVDVP